jgi:hypothetical protein
MNGHNGSEGDSQNEMAFPTSTGTVKFHELTTGSEGMILVTLWVSLDLTFTMDRSGDCGLHFEKSEVGVLTDVLAKVLRHSDDDKEEWTEVGGVDFFSCDNIDHLKDPSGTLLVEAGQGKVRFTIKFNPKSEEVDWPIVMKPRPVRDLMKLLNRVWEFKE